MGDAKPKATGYARFSLAIPTPPPAALHHHYVSPATQSIALTLVSVARAAAPSGAHRVVIALTASNHKDCKPAKNVKLTCTFSVPLPAGRDTLTAALYASTDGKGALLSQATVVTKIAAHKVTSVALVPEGDVATIVPSVTAMSAPDDGATHMLSFTVSALDASGATIVGPARFANPIQLQIGNDLYGALSVAPLTISSPNAAMVKVTYNSHYPLSAGQIALSVMGSKQKAQVGIYPLVLSPTGLTGFLTGAFSPQPETINVSEAADTAAFAVSQVGGSTGSIAAACAPSTCTPASGGASVAVTFTAAMNGTSGSGSFTIGDALGTTLSLPYRISQWANFSAIAAPGHLSNIVSGPDRNLWSIVQSSGNGSFAQMTTSGVVTSYPLPAPFYATNSPAAIAGPDNAIWFGDATTAYVYRLSTAAGSVGTVTKYATADGANPVSFALGIDGQTIYFAESNGNIGVVSLQGDTVSYKPNPDAGGQPGTSLAIDSSGNLYETANYEIFKISPAGVVTQLAEPTLGNGQYLPPSFLTMGPDHNLWIGTQYGYVCSESTAGTTVGCYPIALTTSALSIATGPDGAIWLDGVNAGNRDTLVRTTTSGQSTTYLTPDCCPAANNLTIGPDNALWIASTSGIDRLVP